MSYTEEQLAEANQEGYNEGLLRGKRDGMLTAAVMVRDRASELFLAEREDEAKALRLMNQIIVEGAPDLQQHGNADAST